MMFFRPMDLQFGIMGVLDVNSVIIQNKAPGKREYLVTGGYDFCHNMFLGEIPQIADTLLIWSTDRSM